MLTDRATVDLILEVTAAVGKDRDAMNTLEAFETGPTPGDRPHVLLVEHDLREAATALATAAQHLIREAQSLTRLREQLVRAHPTAFVEEPRHDPDR